MKSPGFISDVLKHGQRVSPKYHTVNGEIQLRSDQVADSDCHDTCHEFEVGDRSPLEGGIATPSEDERAMSSAAMVA